MSMDDLSYLQALMGMTASEEAAGGATGGVGGVWVVDPDGVAAAALTQPRTTRCCAWSARPGSWLTRSGAMSTCWRAAARRKTPRSGRSMPAPTTC